MTCLLRKGEYDGIGHTEYDCQRLCYSKFIQETSAMKQVKSVQYISKEDALSEMTGRLGKTATFCYNPPSLEIKLKSLYTVRQYRFFRQQMKRNKIVSRFNILSVNKPCTYQYKLDYGGTDHAKYYLVIIAALLIGYHPA